MIKIILNAVGILIGAVLGSCINYLRDQKEEKSWTSIKSKD